MKDLNGLKEKLSQLESSRKSILNMTLTAESIRLLSANTRKIVLATGFDKRIVEGIYR